MTKLTYKIRSSRYLKPISHSFSKILVNISPVLASKILYYIFHGKRLDLRNPQLYSEKVQWLKLYNYPNNDLVIEAADKYGMRNYVMKHDLQNLLVPIVGIYDTPSEINFEELPNSFVCKKTNASQLNMIVKKKMKVDKKEFYKKLNRWMSIDFGRKYGEFHYDKSPSKIIIEEYLDNIGEDWKVFFSNDKPMMVQVNKWIDNEDDNYYGHRKTVRLWTDLDGKILDIDADPSVENTCWSINDHINLPEDFQNMLIYGRILAKPFPLVRVDYFHSCGRLYLGELTFTPGSGFEKMNLNIQKCMGKQIDLN